MADGDVLQISGGHQVFAAAGGGGGGVSVDNTVDAPASDVATFVIPGADVGTPGQATLVVFRQVGPYRVRFNDTGMASGGVGKVIGDELPVGAMFLPIILLIEAWDDTPGNLVVDVWWEHGGGVGVPGALNEALDQVAAQGGYGEDTSSTGYPIQAAQTGIYPEKWTRVISGGVQLIVEYKDGGASPTQGIADIYAIIATPAS